MVFPARLSGEANIGSAADREKMINDAGLCKAIAAKKPILLKASQADPNELEILWDLAREFRDFVRANPTVADDSSIQTMSSTRKIGCRALCISWYATARASGSSWISRILTNLTTRGQNQSRGRTAVNFSSNTLVLIWLKTRYLTMSRGGGTRCRSKAEFRFRPTTCWRLAPSIGAARSGNGASFVFADLERDFFVGRHRVVTPNFGLGSFDDGRDVRLGHDLGFRSGIKIACVFDNKVRLGIALFHRSNGGLGDRNLGTEPVFLSLALPL